ncbi:MAG TPA: MBL fold metallo-hydrolase [Longimicrobiaceae bacterium]|nr:MBL fold metallo-hydrolase [Longimicrobiaceae bacterium]
MPRRAAFILLTALLAGCTTHRLGVIQEPGRSVAFPTAGHWASMVYAARTDSGVIVIDLGWHGAAAGLRKRLRSLGAGPEDVTDVFLTHSHRDHTGGWRAVRTARFHLWAPEVPLFTGDSSHADFLSRAARVTGGHAGPIAGEISLRPFSADTAFAFGRDTVRAFTVPGHTAGSAAYLYRGVLFVGDAVARGPLAGFQPARDVFSDNYRQNRESLRSLFVRTAPFDVRWVCNAHAKCAPLDSAFIRRVTR